MALSDQIVGALVKDILSAITEPGARLDQPSICRKFGASRTPIREALRILSRNGLVEVTRRKGVTVRTGVDRLRNMFEALAEFEAHCVKPGAVRMTVLKKKRLEVINLNRELRILDGTGDLAALNTNSTKSSVTAPTTQASHRSREAFGKGLLVFEQFNSRPAKPNMHSTNMTRLGAYTVMRDHGTMAPSYVADRFRTHPGCFLTGSQRQGSRPASDRE
jgi:DNA-binding transcriptional regulator YhcF (GntR family)